MINEEIHLCDNCKRQKVFPVCLEESNIIFSSEIGKDNIIQCNSYEKEGE